MKFIARNIAKKIIIALIILVTIFAGIYANPSFPSFRVNAANKVHKVKNEPIYIMKDKDIFYLKPKQIKKDIMYIEKRDSIIDNNKGDGHVISMPDYEMDFNWLKYKGIKLKKGTKIRTFFIHNLLNCKDTFISPVVRFDYVRIKTKENKWDWSLISVEVM